MSKNKKHRTQKKTVVTKNVLSQSSQIFKILQQAQQYQKAGDWQKAEALYHQVLQKQPENDSALDFYKQLSAALNSKGRITEAFAYLQRALSFNPNHAEMQNDLGIIFGQQSQLEQAKACFEKAIAGKNNFAQAYYNLGIILNEEKQFAEAITCYQKALSITPNYADAYNNLGNALSGQDKIGEAIINYQKAIALNPNYAKAHNNLGVAFKKQEQIAEAIAFFQQAIALNSNYIDAYNNLGLTLHDQKQFKEAETCFKAIFSLNPNYAEAHYNYSFTALKIGNLTTGWLEHEWRLKDKEINSSQLKQPLWDGTELAGRRLLVHWEQGFGDSIQFVRYLSLITEATVIFAGQPALKELFANLLGIDIFIVNPINKEPEIAYDVWIPLMSLPKIFATTLDNIPVCVPYLHPDSQKVEIWRNRLANTSFKIGIVWAGNPKHSNDRNRSCPLIHFAALTKLSNLTLFSLQKGEAAAQPTPEGMELISLTAELENFTDTAAAMACLDLVISVDTAVAHLAGAMGYPVWILLPFVSDWRWLEHREDSPWYPTMRLFRQPSPGDWDNVFNQVVNELVSYTADG